MEGLVGSTVGVFGQLTTDAAGRRCQDHGILLGRLHGSVYSAAAAQVGGWAEELVVVRGTGSVAGRVSMFWAMQNEARTVVAPTKKNKLALLL